ncbi:MAG: hypothetical protein JXI33_07040 [Candidatus Aminicenantes bacterium]|nr:hypothetical protein [Candidatus Aminicenantes bacterium]
MKRVILFLLVVLSWGFLVQARELLDIKGDYLLYSFDFNYVYGQGNILIKSKDFSIQAASLEIDVGRHLARLSRNCRLQLGKEKHTADILEIDLDDLSLRLTTFKDSILSWTLPTQKKVADGKTTEAKTAEAKTTEVKDAEVKKVAVKAAAAKQMTSRDYESLKKSLVYFLTNRIVITSNYRLYGYQCTVFVEGIQSLAFKKFKLDKGIPEQSENGFGLDRIWYYQSQGLVLNSHLLLEKALTHGSFKSVSGLDVSYDIFSAKEDLIGSRGKINFKSLNTLPLDKKSGLSLNLNYLTDNMFNASMTLKTQWTPQLTSDLIAEYTLTTAKKEEFWLRLRSAFNNKILGNFTLNLAYEKEKQYLMEISLQNQAVKNFVLSARHSRSRLLYDQDQYNNQSNSAFSLSYSNKLFNLAADYSFHQDLLLEQSQGNPQIRLNVNPFRLYDGLLQLNFSSSFVMNQLSNRGVRDDISKANMGLALQSEKIQLGRGQDLSFSLAAEQLLDKDPANNYTSLGCIFKGSQSLGNLADFNFLFNYQTRRKTENWFIQGTTSQGWSAVLKLKEKQNGVQGWVSLSYDTKIGRFTSGVLDCSVAIIKNWYVQTQMNYDFIFDKFSYDLYLIRRAGRIMIRASYRSLSKQFLLEVLPN